VAILASPQLANCVDEWIPPEGNVEVETVGSFSLSDTGIRPNSSALCPEFVEEISDALRRVERLKLMNPRSFW